MFFNKSKNKNIKTKKNIFSHKLKINNNHILHKLKLLNHFNYNFFIKINKLFSIKKNFIFKRRKTVKIIKELINQKIKVLLFYTDINNILRHLEFGLQPIKYIKLDSSQEYIVWTYLENQDYLEFELDNSTRHYFWNWIIEQKVNPNQIAVIALDIQILFEKTKNNWIFNNSTRRIQIYENINPQCFKWILIRNNEYIKRICNYIKNNNLNIQIFHGEKGNIIDITKK